jgi:hypothetical protein
MWSKVQRESSREAVILINGFGTTGYPFFFKRGLVEVSLACIPGVLEAQIGWIVV